MYENVKEALFGFNDKETGIKLSAFYKKHTGREVDFNAIKHDKDGFKLLLFSIPLGRISKRISSQEIFWSGSRIYGLV